MRQKQAALEGRPLKHPTPLKEHSLGDRTTSGAGWIPWHLTCGHVRLLRRTQINCQNEDGGEGEREVGGHPYDEGWGALHRRRGKGQSGQTTTNSTAHLIV